MDQFQEDLKKLAPKTTDDYLDKQNKKTPMQKVKPVIEQDLSKYHPDNLTWLQEERGARYLGYTIDGYNRSNNYASYTRTGVDYEVKAHYYETFSQKANKQKIEAFAKDHTFKSARKRKNNAEDAAKYYKQAAAKSKKLQKQKIAYDEQRREFFSHKDFEESESKKLQNSAKKLVDEEMNVLALRQKAMVAAATVKATDKNDYNLRLAKIDLSIIAAKLAVYQCYNHPTQFGTQIKKLQKDYQKKYLELEELKTGLLNKGNKVKKENTSKKKSEKNTNNQENLQNKIPSLPADKKLPLRSALVEEKISKFKGSLSPGEKEQLQRALGLEGEKINVNEFETYNELKTCIKVYQEKVEKHHKTIDGLDAQQTLDLARKYCFTKAFEKDFAEANKAYRMLFNYLVTFTDQQILADEAVSPGIIDDVIKPLLKHSKNPGLYESIVNKNQEVFDQKQIKDEDKVLKPILEYDSFEKKRKPINLSNKENVKRYLQEYMMDEYAKIYNFDRDRAFAHKKFAEKDAVEQQGWKMHIHVSDETEYLKALHFLVPAFQKANLHFKVVHSEGYYNEVGRGKAFTIYPDARADWSKLSPEVLKYLNEKVGKEQENEEGKQENQEDEDTKLKTDKALSGHLSTRYGSTFNSYIITPEGDIMKDDRSGDQENIIGWIGAEKDKISLNDIINFDKRIEKKFNETGNLKAYLQEKYMGRQMSDSEIEDGKYAFHILCFEDNPKKESVFNDYKNKIQKEFVERGIITEYSKKKNEEGKRAEERTPMLHILGHYFLMIPNSVYGKLKIDEQTKKDHLVEADNKDKFLPKGFQFEEKKEFDLEGAGKINEVSGINES